MTDRVGGWPRDLVVVIESKEHYGWPPTEYRVVGIHPGELSPTEFLQVHKVDGEGPALYLRVRFGPLGWEGVGEVTASVGAWPGEPTPDGDRFVPSTSNPEWWLDIRPAGEELR